MWAKAPLHCAVLGSGTMGAGIALSLALRSGADTTVCLWGRCTQSLQKAQNRIADAAVFMCEQGLIDHSQKHHALKAIDYTTHMPSAVQSAHFVIEAVTEDIALKHHILTSAEPYVTTDTILSSTTSALSATDIQSALTHPERFVIAHYAQPAHLVAVVEVVLGKQSTVDAGQKVTDVLNSCGKKPVYCPDIAGFFWARIQHAILRECVSMVERGLMQPADCDTILKSGYGARVPAMGAFEHADLAGLDLMLSPAAQSVWQDLSNISDPTQTVMGKMLANGDVGMSSGKGFYRWNTDTVSAFKQTRDKEIVRRVKICAGGEVHMQNM